MIRSTFTPAIRALTRGLRTTAPKALPGSHGATMHGNNPETLEKEKQKNLKGENLKDSPAPIDHSPGWNEKLASKSEAEVKADQSGGSPKEMQKETAERASEQSR